MIVTTGCGKLEATTRDGVVEALGIPFARAERLSAPVRAERWSGTLDATEFGPASLQPPGEVFMAVDMPLSEDCLSLNVWAPEAAVGSAPERPVMVWIHGGGFRQGSGAHMLSRGQVLAARGDVVVVTVNYRLGALGFLAHPELADDGVCGNWGVLDLVAALQWVRDEIGAFGGDAGNVTLFGESAGGTLVSLLGASRAASGLFRRMIVQSGVPTAASRSSAPAAWPKRSRSRSASQTCAPCATCRATRSSARRSRSESRRGGRMVFIPCVDGAVVEQPPIDALAAGAAAGIPMMIGTNVDELRLMSAGDPRRGDLDADGLRRRLDKLMDGAVDEVIERVTRAREARGEATTPSDLWFAIESDRFFRVPSIRAADAHVSARAAHVRLPVRLAFARARRLARRVPRARDPVRVRHPRRAASRRLHGRRPRGRSPQRADDGRLGCVRAVRRSVDT